MKRILHIISQYPGKTGSGIYLNELIREANKKGYEQGLIGAIDEYDYKNPFIKDKYNYLLKFNTEEIPFSIIGMSDEMPYRSTKYTDLNCEELKIYIKNFKKIIERAVLEFKPDIIITHHLWIVSSLLKDIAKDIKIIGISHGTDIAQLKKNERFKDMVIVGNKKIDLILALNDYQKEEIAKLYNISKGKIISIGGGYNDEVFYPDFKYNDKPILTYAGKISYEKGLISLLRAIENIDNKFKFKLILAGSGVGEQFKNIIEYTKKINKDIEYIGELNQVEVGDLFRKSDIFLMPSYSEGLSLVTIEAIASGNLIVSSRIEGLINYLGEDINNSGIIKYIESPKFEKVDIYSKELLIYEEEFKDNIEMQLSNIENRELVYRSVEANILELSWNKIFNRIEKAIELLD